MKNSIYGLVLTALLFLSGQSQAVVLSLNPSLTLADNGDVVSLDLVISELGESGAPSLGDFDINFAYDISVISFNGYVLGDQLGDLNLFEADDWSLGDIGGGVINLTELSYLMPADLHSLQSSSFTLATLDFTVDNLWLNETTTVSIGAINALGDQDGVALTNITTHDAVIAGTSVPEPSILWLLGLGVISLRLRHILGGRAV